MNKQSQEIASTRPQGMVPARTSTESGLTSVFSRLRNEIDQLFDDFTVPSPMRRVFQWPDGADFSPLVELKEKDDQYELAIELPGLDDKGINVEFVDGVLSISGEKHEESEEKSGSYLISERSYGSFHRSLSLPSDADPDKIEAKYRHGVLKVQIGKDKQAADRVRKIAVT
jgi:HSP20 family protein